MGRSPRRAACSHPVAALPRWGDLQRIGPVDVRETRRPKARLLSCGFGFERGEDFLRGDWDLVDADAHRVVDGVGERRHHWQERPLTDFLGAEWAARIGVLDQLGEDLRHVERRRALVFEHRRKLVDERPGKTGRQPAELLLLHQRLAERHVDTAFDLAADERRVQRAADVVRDPDRAVP